FHSTGHISVTPPSDGTYEGISLFQNRNSKAKIEFKKDSDIDISGAIYAPNSKVSFKDVALDAGGYYDEEDEDWETDADSSESLADDGGAGTSGSINASLVARILSLDKRSRIRF